MPVIRHYLRERNENGVQDCRRCGIVIIDAFIHGDVSLEPGVVFQVNGTTFCEPFRVGKEQQDGAINCPWRVH